MLAIRHEYLAECHRQHVEPYKGFMDHLDACSIDTDLDHVPVQSIRIFALALSRVGLDAQHSLSSSAAPFPSARRAPSARVTRLRPSSVVNLRRAHPVSLVERGTSSSPGDHGEKMQNQRLLQGKLVKLRLRYGRRKELSKSNNASSPRQGPSLRSQASAEKKRANPPTTGLQTKGFNTIVAPTQRRALAELVDGVRHALQVSCDTLRYFEFSGFPLHEVTESTTRLMQTLASCSNLRSLSLKHSQLTTMHFAKLTTSSAKCFPRLVEASFAGCGLTDACARGLQSLLCLRRDSEVMAYWQRSLRSLTPRRGSQKDTHGAPVTMHSSTTALARLDVSENDLGDCTLRALGQTLRRDSSLRFLDFSRNAASREGLLQFVFSGVLEDSGLEAVDLSHNAQNSEPNKAAFPSDREDALPLLQLPYPLGGKFRCVHHGLGQCLLLRHHGEASDDPSKAPPSSKPLSINTNTAVPLSRHHGSDECQESKVGDSPPAYTQAFSVPHQTLPRESRPEASCFSRSRAPSPARDVPGRSSMTPARSIELNVPKPSCSDAASPGYFAGSPPISVPGGFAPVMTTGATLPWFTSGNANAYASCFPMLMVPTIAVPTGCPRCTPAIAQAPESALLHDFRSMLSVERAAASPRTRDPCWFHHQDVGVVPVQKKAPPTVSARLDRPPVTLAADSLPERLQEEAGQASAAIAGEDQKPKMLATTDTKETVTSTDFSLDPHLSEAPLTPETAPTGNGKDSPKPDDTKPDRLEKGLENILRFLTFSIEHQDLQLVERLEKYHQQTMSRLDLFRRDLVDRISRLGENQRSMEDRLIEQIEAGRASAPDSWRENETQLMNDLTTLIQAGMNRVKKQVDVPDTPKHQGSGEVSDANVMHIQRSAQLHKTVLGFTEETAQRTDFLREINTRLKALGW